MSRPRLQGRGHPSRPAERSVTSAAPWVSTLGNARSVSHTMKLAVSEVDREDVEKVANDEDQFDDKFVEFVRGQLRVLYPEVMGERKGNGEDHQEEPDEEKEAEHDELKPDLSKHDIAALRRIVTSHPHARFYPPPLRGVSMPGMTVPNGSPATGMAEQMPGMPMPSATSMATRLATSVTPPMPMVMPPPAQPPSPMPGAWPGANELQLQQLQRIQLQPQQPEQQLSQQLHPQQVDPSQQQFPTEAEYQAWMAQYAYFSHLQAMQQSQYAFGFPYAYGYEGASG